MASIESIKSELQALIDDANTTTGGSATTVREGVDALREKYLPTGSMEGLENGYDVMFYDENNDGLAFYSIKQGHAINAPEYTCQNWQDADGAVITFPYTPTADAIFYANNSTYASQLYGYYGIDSGVYPYMWIEYNSYNGEWGVYVAKTRTSDLWFAVGLYNRVKGSALSDMSDIESVVAYVTSIVAPSNSTDGNLALNNSDKAYYTVYTNFDITFSNATLYRLDG